MSRVAVVTLAVVTGDAVWIGLAVVTALWVAVASRTRALVGPRAVLDWLLSSWAGRLSGLAIWALAGWHLFCQRP